MSASFKERFLSSALMAVVAHKSRPLPIRMYLTRKKFTRATMPTRDKVKIGVVQMKIDLLDDGEKFAEKMYALTSQAVEQGAQLVVFPESSWMPILGILPPLRLLAEKGVALDTAIGELSPGGGMKIEDAYRAIAPAVNRIFETTGNELASRFGIYLMLGSAIAVAEQARMYSTAYLFGPNGAVIGTQNKLQPNVIEQPWLTLGKELNVFDLPFARVAMPVCMDYTYWQSAQAVIQNGAEVLLGMAALAQEHEFFQSTPEVEKRLRENLAFHVCASCVTPLFGLNYCGPSSVVAAPNILLRTEYIAGQATSRDMEQVFVVELDLQRLRQVRAERAH